MKIQLAHDFLNQYGGGERVMELFAKVLETKDVKTIAYNPRKMPENIKRLNIETSFIQRLPFAKNKYKWYLPLMPFAVERLRFKDVDVVLSDSSGLIKGINTPKDTLHICYIHTSTRYLTVDRDYFKYTVPSFLHFITPTLLKRITQWDYRAAKKPHIYIANSKTTAARVLKYYQRKVDYVLFPPVDTQIFKYDSSLQKEDYYLVAGRLVPYKRVDLAIKACGALKRKLIVVGEGPAREVLEKQAEGMDVHFVGAVSDVELVKYYQKAKALIFPPLEDAGMTPLEAMACGTPVIAYGKGGARESISEDKTGVFFNRQEEAELMNAINRFEAMRFSSKDIVEHAKQFSAIRFGQEIKRIIDAEYKLFLQKHKIC